jgi:hypothetical protein
MSNTKTINLKLSTGSVEGAEALSILDASTGQFGTVKSVQIMMEVEVLPKPVIPFMDVSKLTAAGIHPGVMAAMTLQNLGAVGAAPAAKAPATKAANQAKGGAAPAVKPAAKQDAAQAASGVPTAGSPVTENGITTVTIKKASKIGKLMSQLMLKDGSTVPKLMKAMDVSETGVTSYLYYYPKQYGCELLSEAKAGKDRVYKLSKPDNINIVFK